jgi:ABC-type lipoprotein release transport system permease subunit
MLLRLAWLNIWRNKGRTLIMLVGIAFAVFFSTINQSNKIGLFNRMIRNSVGYYTGYLQIHRADFWEDRSINSCFSFDDSTISKLTNNYGIERFVPRIESYALASANEKTRGVMMIGIEPQSENLLTSLSSRLVEGEYLNAGDNQVIMGNGVAEFLKKNVGDTVDFIGQGYHGANAVNRFRIKGIVNYPMAHLNNSVVYLPLRACKDFFATEDQVTTYCLMVDPDKVDGITATLSNQLKVDDYEVMDWKAMMPELLQSIKLLQIMNGFIYLILYIILGFGIFGTYYMMLHERSYEFGIMIASGMKRFKLQMVAMAEVIMMALAGLVLGLSVSFLFLSYYQDHPITLTGQSAEVYLKLGVEPIFELPLTFTPFIVQAVVIFLMSIAIGTYSIRRINKLDINLAIR